MIEQTNTSKSADLESWLNTPVPDVLWHYTSLHGFYGIISSQQIWATECRYLNDREEFVHAQTIAYEVASSLPELDDNGWQSREKLTSMVEHLFTQGVLSKSSLQVFIVSFTEAEDALSQWRGYAGHTAGVSLGFDLQTIRPDRSLESLVAFAPCVYDENTKRSLITQAIKALDREGSRMWKETGDPASALALKTEAEEHLYR